MQKEVSKVKMRTVRIVLCVVLTTMLSACGGGGDDGDTSNSGTVGYFTVGEDGVRSSPWGSGNAFSRPAMAVKFTPTSYPVTITSVTIYPVNNTGMDQLFNLFGLSDLSAETDLFSPVLGQVIPDTGNSYFAKTIDIPPTTISSGSFYIAVEWVTKPLSAVSGANSFFLRTDSRLDHLDTNFMRSSAIWRSYESVSTKGGGDTGILVNH